MDGDRLISHTRLFFASGGLLAFIAVAMGALGSHLLKNQLDAYAMSIFIKAGHYLILHALMIIVLPLTSRYSTKPAWVFMAGKLFIIGSLLFSGSLYVLSLTGIKQWAMITPVGGIALLVAWLLWVIAFMVNTEKNTG